MRTAVEFVKHNKKVILIVALIAVLICIVYFVYGSGTQSSTAAVSQTVEKTDEEIKLEKILSCIEGVGTTEVMINQSDDHILGVVIVCEGADNIMTRSNILNAVSTALNIDKTIIAIYSMNV